MTMVWQRRNPDLYSDGVYDADAERLLVDSGWELRDDGLWDEANHPEPEGYPLSGVLGLLEAVQVTREDADAYLESTTGRQELYLDYLSDIQDVDANIAELQLRLNGLREHRKELEDGLMSKIGPGFQGVNGHGYKVRWTTGRTVTSWDAVKLDNLLPPELKAAALSYMPKANTSVLTALEKAGKLSPELLAEVKAVTEPNGRWVLEKESA